MPNGKHQQRAREALSIRTLTPMQMEDCIPSVAAALEAVERETAQRCAEIAAEHGCAFASRAFTDACGSEVAGAIRAEFGIAEGKS